MNKTLKKYRQKIAKTIILLLCGMLTVTGCTKDDTNSDLVASGTTGPLTWALDADGTLTISGKGEMPDYSNESPSPWHEYKDDIISAIIENDVITIGDWAFFGCNKLISVAIGNSVISIGSHAFFGCSILQSFTIPQSVTTVEDVIFNRCGGEFSEKPCHFLIEVINYRETPQNIDKDLFAGKIFSNTLLLVPAGSIEAYRAADGWNSFCRIGEIGNSGSIVIGSTTGSIKWSLSDDEKTLIFSGTGTIEGNRLAYRHGYDYYQPWSQWRESVTHIVVNEEISQFADNAYMWPNLIGFEVSVDNPYISSSDGILFNKEKNILLKYPPSKQDESFTIPNSVTIIGNSAFSDCSYLSCVTIPYSVTEIGDNAFSDCTGLTSITVPNSVIETGRFTFSGCKGLISVTIPNGVTTIGSAFSNTGITSIIIPNSVTKIGANAFYNCTDLISINMPNSVTSIEEWAFRGCTGLSEIINQQNIPQILKSWSEDIDVFEGVDKIACILYVPIGSIEAYRAADGWKDFVNIKEIQ